MANTFKFKGVALATTDETALLTAGLDETLIMAGIKECRSLVVTLPNDASNLYVVLSAKGLNKNCRLIARAATEEASNKLKLAGANAVVSPYVAAGRTMAASALRPIAVDFFDLLAGSNCEIEEFKLTDNLERIQNLNDALSVHQAQKSIKAQPKVKLNWTYNRKENFLKFTMAKDTSK